MDAHFGSVSGSTGNILPERLPTTLVHLQPAYCSLVPHHVTCNVHIVKVEQLDVITAQMCQPLPLVSCDQPLPHYWHHVISLIISFSTRIHRKLKG